MWTWPFKISPLGIGTIIAGVVVVSSSLAAALVNEKVETCNAQWSVKILEREQAMALLRADMQERIDALVEKVRVAEEEANLKSVTDAVTVEKQRESDKLSDNCDKCRVPNSWIWVLPGKAGDKDQSRPAAASGRVPAKTGSTR